MGWGDEGGCSFFCESEMSVPLLIVACFCPCGVHPPAGSDRPHSQGVFWCNHHSNCIDVFVRGDTLNTIEMKHKASICHNQAHIYNQTSKSWLV